MNESLINLVNGLTWLTQVIGICFLMMVAVYVSDRIVKWIDEVRKMEKKSKEIKGFNKEDK